MTAVCRQEMEAIRNLQRPLRLEGIVAPGGYKPDRALKLSVCHDFLKVVYHILPSEKFPVHVLWHKDLHLGNIFVDPERPTEILALTHWQNFHVVRLFDRVTHPVFLDYKGPKVEGHKPPTPPANFEELDDSAKEHGKKLLVYQTLNKYYDLFSASLKVPTYRALGYQGTLQGEIITKRGPPWPLKYSTADIGASKN